MVYESVVQSRVIARLHRKGYYVIKLIRTNKNGIPDLLALKGSKSIFIEVKRPGAVPTPLQCFRHDELRKQGFPVFVIDHEDKLIL